MIIKRRQICSLYDVGREGFAWQTNNSLSVLLLPIFIVKEQIKKQSQFEKSKVTRGSKSLTNEDLDQ